MKNAELKEKKVEAAWKQIKDIAPEPVYLALRRFASGFDGTRICEWLASLWDPETGGFYYSDSARDNDGFLPDIESTSQAIAFLQCFHATNDRNKLLPNEVKRRIMDFIIGCQSEDDGYFYHPQWPHGKDKLRVDRYGRDLGSATGLLNSLTVDRDGDGVEERQFPKVCTPSGVKCKKHFGTDEVCECIKRKPVSKPTQPTPAKADASQGPDMPDFTSPETFTAWLEKINADIKNNAGTPAHFINSQSSEIINRGYVPLVLDYVDRIQDEVYAEQTANGETPSGLWSYRASYPLAQSLHKYFAFYNHKEYGRPFRYYKEAIATAIDILLLDAEGKKGLNDLMNQWTSINHIIDNVRKYHPEDVPVLYEMIRARGVEIIASAEHNLDAHRLGDGRFVYYMGKTLSNLYGVNVSLGVREGDVNGHLLAGHYYSSVFRALNYPTVPLCTDEDGEYFVELLMRKIQK